MSYFTFHKARLPECQVSPSHTIYSLGNDTLMYREISSTVFLVTEGTTDFLLISDFLDT